jgi:hypothetical protein
MRSAFSFVLVLPLAITGCGGAVTEEAPAPAISTSAADNLIPGQLARGVALQTEIRSAGNDCTRVIRTFQQGTRDGESVWDAECEGGGTYGVISRSDGDTEVLACDELERLTGTSCWEKVEE